MGEHGYERVKAVRVNQGDSVLSVWGRQQVTHVVQIGDNITFHLANGQYMRLKVDTKVEKMRS
jgi:hypothetical protein